MSQVKLSTNMREAFIEASPDLKKSSAGLIHRKTMWNVQKDKSPRQFVKKYAAPKRKFKKQEVNRSQMYEFSSH